MSSRVQQPGQCSIISWLPLALTFFLPLLCCALSLEVGYVNVLFRAEHSTVAYSQHLLASLPVELGGSQSACV